MSISISPIGSHSSGDFHPPGIITDFWGYMVSTVSQAALESFITGDLSGSGLLTSNIRTPALGSKVTYIGITSDQRAAALTAGAAPAPSEGKCRRQAFDFESSITSWE